MGMPVTVKGQVTIPKPIRDRLGLAPGSKVDFEVVADGQVVLRKAEAPHASTGPFQASARRATAGLSTDEIMAMTRGED